MDAYRTERDKKLKDFLEKVKAFKKQKETEVGQPVANVPAERIAEPPKRSLLSKHLQEYEELIKVQPQRHTESQLLRERQQKRRLLESKQREELDRLRKQYQISTYCLKNEEPKLAVLATNSSSKSVQERVARCKGNDLSCQKHRDASAKKDSDSAAVYGDISSSKISEKEQHHYVDCKGSHFNNTQLVMKENIHCETTGHMLSNGDTNSLQGVLPAPDKISVNTVAIEEITAISSLKNETRGISMKTTTDVKSETRQKLSNLPTNDTANVVLREPASHREEMVTQTNSEDDLQSIQLRDVAKSNKRTLDMTAYDMVMRELPKHVLPESLHPVTTTTTNGNKQQDDTDALQFPRVDIDLLRYPAFACSRLQAALNMKHSNSSNAAGDCSQAAYRTLSSDTIDTRAADAVTNWSPDEPANRLLLRSKYGPKR